MQKDRDFLRRRLEEAIFHYWLLKNHSEKNPGYELSADLADDYKKKYEHLIREYLRLFSEDYS
ncbi:MAG: hypothetical protein UHM85_06470 [Acutalibacteraceae bacterium]|nr:hypothetical protein [Acutalibacteraceae bacterium]